MVCSRSGAPGDVAAKVAAEEAFNRGKAYLSKGDDDRAFADYNQAIKLDPKYAAAYSNRGSAYELKGDYDRAFEDYSQAITLNPKSASAYTSRGLAYERKGDYDRAIADYTEAVKLEPNNEMYKWFLEDARKKRGW